MSLSELLDDEEFREFNSEDYELVLHLRKSTGGGVRPELCHPFPILSANRLRGYSKALLFHNGTFGLNVPKKYRDRLSDTAYLAMFARRIGLANFKLMLKYDILNRNKSRVLLWTDTGFLFKGKWHEYKGLKVSKPIAISYSYSSSSNWKRSLWDWKTDDYEYDFGGSDNDIDIDVNVPVPTDNVDYEIEVDKEGRRVFLINGGKIGEKLKVLGKASKRELLLEDGSLWEAPEELLDVVQEGDYVQF